MIIFTDLDGTLLNDAKEVSPENRAAIDRALHGGHRIVITTGRPLPSAKKLAADLKLDGAGCYLIASNGGLLYDCEQDKILREIGLKREYVRFLLDEAKKRGIHCHSYSKTHVLCESMTDELEGYSRTIQVPYRIVPSITEYLDYDPWKVILINSRTLAPLAAFREALAEWEKGKCTSIYSSTTMLEYCPFGATKGEGVTYMCRHLNIPLSEAIAAGDAENDISMIEAAGIGVAMANAAGQVKERADYVTHADANHSGFAEIIDRFC